MDRAHDIPQIITADDPAAVVLAARTLASDALVALPTETVYGLGADATRGEAVAQIFAAKGRPHFNPLIAHVDSLAMAQTIAVFEPLAVTLADHFWPGPLTLVLPVAHASGLHPLVTAGLDTVALRQPRGVMADVISALGRPVAAPSANPSGRLSPTSARAVADGLGSKVPLILDGGDCAVGVESTIIAVSGGQMHLLRPGGVPVEEIETVTGQPVIRDPSGSGKPVQAPGQLLSHYAPNAWLRLNADAVLPGEALLAFGGLTITGAHTAVAVQNLSPQGDLVEAAANLFAMLAGLDASGAQCIAVAPVPDHGLGLAINDRLRRAAAPRTAHPNNEVVLSHG